MCPSMSEKCSILWTGQHGFEIWFLGQQIEKTMLTPELHEDLSGSIGKYVDAVCVNTVHRLAGDMAHQNAIELPAQALGIVQTPGSKESWTMVGLKAAAQGRRKFRATGLDKLGQYGEVRKMIVSCPEPGIENFRIIEIKNSDDEEIVAAIKIKAEIYPYFKERGMAGSDCLLYQGAARPSRMGLQGSLPCASIKIWRISPRPLAKTAPRAA